jgi:carbamoyl-phosphate synthase small subunit
VYHLRRLMETSQVPIMGICMGHQLLALAAGAKTVKLPCMFLLFLASPFEC